MKRKLPNIFLMWILLALVGCTALPATAVSPTQTPGFAPVASIAPSTATPEPTQTSDFTPVASVAPSTATPGPTPMSAVITLVNGTLIDGSGANPVSDAAVVIQDGRIVAVGPRAEVTIPAEAQVIDVHSGTILPGLINAHVHFAFDEKKLQTWAWHGVTTVRDEGIMSSRPLTELITLRDQAHLNPGLARLVSAGRMMSVPGGYGDLFVTSPEEARQKVFEQLDQGVDLIKLSQEDGYAGVHDLPKLTTEEMAAIIVAAHERGTLVSGHITQARYMEIVVEAGVDDVAHIAYDPISDAVIERMVAQDIYLVPTFTVFRNYGAPIDACVDNLRRFVAAGGKVALGNDYGGGPGDFELGLPMYEIERMAEAGMTPLQIIVAATGNAAHVCNLEQELGTLEVGKLADVLVVNGDPLQDIHTLADVWLVIHAGVIIRAEDD